MFLRFFIEEKLPGISMQAIKSSGWEFIVKTIEFLDSQLQVEYISAPLPLLWRIVREGYLCTGPAGKFMTSRLLNV